MVAFTQQLKAELSKLEKVDASLPDAKSLDGLRSLMVEARIRNPVAFTTYDRQYKSALSAPLNRRNIVNVRRARVAERRARKWFKQKLGKDVGANWKLAERDWAGFFANLADFLKVIVPLFAACGV